MAFDLILRPELSAVVDGETVDRATPARAVGTGGYVPATPPPAPVVPTVWTEGGSNALLLVVPTPLTLLAMPDYAIVENATWVPVLASIIFDPLNYPGYTIYRVDGNGVGGFGPGDHCTIPANDPSFVGLNGATVAAGTYAIGAWPP